MHIHVAYAHRLCNYVCVSRRMLVQCMVMHIFMHEYHLHYFVSVLKNQYYSLFPGSL